MQFNKYLRVSVRIFAEACIVRTLTMEYHGGDRGMKFIFESSRAGVVVLAFFLSVVLLTTGCFKGSASKEELLRDGLRLMNEKNYRGAIVFFKNAIEKDPNFVDARFQLAKAYAQLGNLDAAEKDLQKVLLQMPSLKDARIELARVKVYQDKPDEALKELADYIGDASADADALEVAGQAYGIMKEYTRSEDFLRRAIAADSAGKTTAGLSLAKLYISQEKPREAKEQIKEMLKKDPTSSGALYFLARIQLKEKEMDAALATYERIIKDRPDDAEAYFSKGNILIAKKEYDVANALAADMMTRFPKSPEGYRLKGIVLVMKNKAGDAVTALQKSITLGPNAGAYYFLGLAQTSRNEPEQAISNFNKALDLNPLFHSARILLASVLLKQERVDEAITEVSKVINADPKNAYAYNVLASAYMKKGMLAESMEELNKALAIKPQLAEVHIKKGLVNIQRGQTEEAELDLRAAVQSAPDILNPRLILASFYSRSGDYGKAISVLKEGLKGTKEDAPLYNYIARFYFIQNNVDESIKMLSTAKDINPDDLTSYVNLAKIYIMKKDYERGIQELNAVLAKAPDNLMAITELAGVYERLNRDGDAVKYYEQAKASKKMEGYTACANYFVRKKDYDKAIGVLNEAIAQHPADISPYQLKANIWASQKNYPEVLKTFEQLEKVDPKRGVAAIINTYLVMKKNDDALKKATRAWEKDPRNLNLMADISRIHMIMGNKQESIRNAKDIINTRPDSPVGYLTLATVYKNDGEIDHAIEALKRAASVKDASIDMMLGGIYLEKKEYTSALETYRKLEKTTPGYVAAIFQQGVVYAVMGKSNNAVEEYSRALRLSSNYLPALNNIAYIYADENRELKKALQYASRAYAIAPHEGPVNDTMGFVLLKNGKTEDAYTALKRASELMPENATVLYHLALACHERGDKAQATGYLQRALQIGRFPEEKKAQVLLQKMKG